MAAWVADRRPPSAVVAQYTDDPEAVPDSVAELVRRDFVESCGRSRNGTVTELGWIAEGWGVSPRDVTVPVRCWHGERDRNVPVEDARRLCERLPDGELRTMGADHLTALLEARSRALDT